MKRRLVGAIVLVSLAVIFLPVLLENPKDYRPHIQGSNVPSMPTAQAPGTAALPISETEPLIPALPPQSAPATTAAASAPPVPPQEVAATAPAELRPAVAAWAVQVAGPPSRKQAEQLVHTLRKRGFSAFLETVRSGERTLIRIRVGPEVDRIRAQHLATTIEKRLKLKSHVVRYP
jgi:DedD protein